MVVDEGGSWVVEEPPSSLAGVLRSLADGAFFGETWGDGAPRVLALHGWRRTHDDFSTSLGPASARGALPTVAPDLPGFGATPAPAEAWGSSDYAGAVVRLLEPTCESPMPAGVVVVGHSLGGRIAVRLAAQRPELVGALVLTGAPLLPRPGGGRRPASGFRVARVLHRAHLVSDERMERARRRHGSVDYRAATGVMRDSLVRIVNERYEESLALVRCPVALLWGEDDREAPVNTARALHALLPGSTLTLVPGAGHLTPVTAPDALRAAVDTILERGA